LSVLRTVRSFVRREGRITESQRRAIDRLWDRYGADLRDDACDLDTLFGRRAPRMLEIGFGAGEALLAMAAAHPENDYLGIEVYRPGVGRLLKALDERGITNVRVMRDDAVEILAGMIPPSSLDAVYLFFPDPWPKKRHHKRRIVQSAFAALVGSRLRPGGLFHMATDWEDYAQQMMAVMTHAPGFENTAGPGRYAERPAWREGTRFERRGERLGHAVHDLIFRKLYQ
jgi:tRNA (guanine-N7-)-methyltransferase